jgi:hypothetical protein
MVMLLIVMAVVLMLVANAWRTMAPAALDTHDALKSPPLTTHGQEEAAQEVRKGGLPGVYDTKAETDKHTAEVEEALASIE